MWYPSSSTWGKYSLLEDRPLGEKEGALPLSTCLECHVYNQLPFLNHWLNCQQIHIFLVGPKVIWSEQQLKGGVVASTKKDQRNQFLFSLEQNAISLHLQDRCKQSCAPAQGKRWRLGLLNHFHFMMHVSLSSSRNLQLPRIIAFLLGCLFLTGLWGFFIILQICPLMNVCIANASYFLAFLFTLSFYHCHLCVVFKKSA